MGTAGCLIFNVRDRHTNSGRGVPGRGGGTYSAYALSFFFLKRTSSALHSKSRTHDSCMIASGERVSKSKYIYIKRGTGGHPGYKQFGEYARVSLISHGLLI